MIHNALKYHGIRITQAAAIQGTRKLYVAWDSGDEAVLDYGPLIAVHAALGPLADPRTFQSARVGKHGLEVVWTDAINGGADSLRQLADEQHAVFMRKKAV